LPNIENLEINVQEDLTQEATIQQRLSFDQDQGWLYSSYFYWVVSFQRHLSSKMAKVSC